MPVFRLFRHQAPPWRCGAGFTSEMFVRARCNFFFSREKRPGGPLRGGAGRGSTRRCSYELDVRFFFRARSELGGPSVAVRGGVQLGDVRTSSMSASGPKLQKFYARPCRLRRLLVESFKLERSRVTHSSSSAIWLRAGAPNSIWRYLAGPKTEQKRATKYPKYRPNIAHLGRGY